MLKKLGTLLLAVSMVFGTIAVMPVSAANSTLLAEADFTGPFVPSMYDSSRATLLNPSERTTNFKLAGTNNVVTSGGALEEVNWRNLPSAVPGDPNGVVTTDEHVNGSFVPASGAKDKRVYADAGGSSPWGWNVVHAFNSTTVTTFETKLKINKVSNNSISLKVRDRGPEDNGSNTTTIDILEFAPDGNIKINKAGGAVSIYEYGSAGNLDKWIHVYVVLTGKNVDVYINGVLEANATNVELNIGACHGIGTFASWYAKPHDGQTVLFDDFIMRRISTDDSKLVFDKATIVNNAGGVNPAQKDVWLKFDKMLQSKGTVTIYKDSEPMTTGVTSVIAPEDGTRIKVSFDDELAGGSDYRIAYSGVTDIWGQTADDGQLNFSTGIKPRVVPTTLFYDDFSGADPQVGTIGGNHYSGDNRQLPEGTDSQGRPWSEASPVEGEAPGVYQKTSSGSRADFGLAYLPDSKVFDFTNLGDTLVVEVKTKKVHNQGAQIDLFNIKGTSDSTTGYLIEGRQGEGAWQGKFTFMDGNNTVMTATTGRDAWAHHFMILRVVEGASAGATKVTAEVYINGAKQGEYEVAPNGVTELSDSLHIGGAIWDDSMVFDDFIVRTLGDLTLQKSSVQEGATGVSPAGAIYMNYNMLLNNSTLSNVKVYKTGETDPVEGVSVSRLAADNTRLKITFGTALEADTEYTIDYSGLGDVLGSTVADDSTITFTTGKGLEIVNSYLTKDNTAEPFGTGTFVPKVLVNNNTGAALSGAFVYAVYNGTELESIVVNSEPNNIPAGANQEVELPAITIDNASGRNGKFLIWDGFGSMKPIE